MTPELRNADVVAAQGAVHRDPARRHELRRDGLIIPIDPCVLHPLPNIPFRRYSWTVAELMAPAETMPAYDIRVVLTPESRAELMMPRVHALAQYHGNKDPETYRRYYLCSPNRP